MVFTLCSAVVDFYKWVDYWGKYSILYKVQACCAALKQLLFRVFAVHYLDALSGWTVPARMARVFYGKVDSAVDNLTATVSNALGRWIEHVITVKTFF